MPKATVGNPDSCWSEATSQNFKSMTGHAGKTRRFIVFNVGTPYAPPEVVWLDLSLEMSFHEFSGRVYPLEDVDVILATNASQGFITKLAQRGVQVVTCGESDPRKEVRD